MSDLGNLLSGLTGDYVGPKKTNANLNIPFAESVTKSVYDYLFKQATYSDHRTEGFHASGMYSICDREKALEMLYPDKEFVEYIEPDLRMKFTLGHAIHAMVQDDLLGPAGIIMGGWKCRRCAAFCKGFDQTVENNMLMFPSKGCENCGGQQWTYIEPRIRIKVPGVPDEPRWNIVGACDGVRQNRHILDIKTISPNGVAYLYDAWESIGDVKKWSEPDESGSWAKKSARKYYVQLQLYMHGFGSKRGMVYYVPKDKIDDLRSWIEIPVEYNSYVIEQMFEKVNNIYGFYKTLGSDVALPKKICKTVTSDRAKNCPFVEECFRKHG